MTFTGGRENVCIVLRTPDDVMVMMTLVVVGILEVVMVMGTVMVRLLFPQ